MLSTELTRRLGIEHPIIQAGMGNDSGAELAAAVSNAGALGSVGSIGRSPRAFREELARCRDLTGKPFAVNVVTWDWAPFAEELLTVALEERAPVVTVSFGDWLPSLRRCQDAGVPAVVQVQDFPAAEAALRERPAALVVQGHEAGGHTGRRGTMSLATQVLEIAGDVPVVVAGGVGNGRGLAAVLAMGAAGVVMGTRFKATQEFGPEAPHGEAQKAAIVASDGENTAWDEIFDEAYGMEWPNGIEGRALRSPFSQEWSGRAGELRVVREAGQPFEFVGKLSQSPETIINWAGESSSVVREILPAAEVVTRTVAEAEALLRRVSQMLETATSR